MSASSGWLPVRNCGLCADCASLTADRFLVQIAEAEEQHRRERLAKEQQQEADGAIKGGKAQ